MLFKQVIYLNSIESKALIDLRVAVSFIILREIKWYKIKMQKKKQLYELITIDRLAISSREVNQETKLVKITLSIYKKVIILDIIKITRNKIVLGKD